MSKYKNS